MASSAWSPSNGSQGSIKNPGQIWRMTPQKRQQFLKGLGYTVPTDGRSGARTAATAWGWSHGMSPDLVASQGDPWFNTVWQQYFAKKNPQPNSVPRDGHRPPTAAVQAQAAAVRAAVAARRAGAQGAHGGGAGGGAGGDAGGSAGSFDSDLITPTNTASGPAFTAPNVNLIDPRKFATGSVDAEYGPRIAEMVRVQDRAREQYKQAVKDVQGWYGSSLKGYDDGTAAGKTSDAAALTSFDQAGQNLGAAFGGEANDSLGSAASIAAITRGGLQAQQGNHSAYRQNMRDALVMTGRDEQNRILAQGLADDTEMGAKVADARGARGAAWNEAFQSATAQRGQQQRDAFTDRITAALAADEVKAGSLANVAAGQNIDMNNIRIGMGLDQTEEGGTPAWGKIDPGQRASLRENLLNGLIGDGGNLAVNPMQAFNRMGSTLRSVSNGKWNPFTNPEVRAWRNELLQEMIPEWNRTHPNKKYRFKGGKIVFVGKRK